MSPHEREVLVKGRGEFYGISGFFDWLETKRYKIHVRVLLARYRAYTLCPDCTGARLGPGARAVRFRGRTLPQLAELPLGELQGWFAALDLTEREEERLSSIVAEIRARVRYMNDVGLEYLTLARPARTLSGGEAQRIGLASALGGSLTGTLYVLDEPTIGLHAADTRRLIGILRRLSDRGNTVVVVEHDPEVMEAADHVIDLGPGAGSQGGHLLFQGSPRSLARQRSSATGALLRRRGARSAVPLPRRGDPAGRPRGRVPARRGRDRDPGRREHNLKNLTVRIPLGRLVCVSGVSGSGKSTLVRDILHNSYARRVKGTVQLDVGAHDRIDGLEGVSDLLSWTRPPWAARPGPIRSRTRRPGTRSARSSRARRAPSLAGSRRAIFPSTPSGGGARPAKARAGRPSTCSSWPTSPYAATPATAGVSAARSWRSATGARTSTTSWR